MKNQHTAIQGHLSDTGLMFEYNDICFVVFLPRLLRNQCHIEIHSKHNASKIIGENYRDVEVEQNFVETVFTVHRLTLMKAQIDETLKLGLGTISAKIKLLMEKKV